MLSILLGLLLELPAFSAQTMTDETHERVLKLLRDTISTRERQYHRVPPVQPAPRMLTLNEMELLYLQNKITAREFQSFLREHYPEIASPDSTSTPGAPIIVNDPRPAPLPGTAETGQDIMPALSPEQAAISDLEKKMDDLLRLKAAREQAARTNSISGTEDNPLMQPGPKTKRQRLDELLKLHIEGGISETEYRDKREKILFAPE